MAGPISIGVDAVQRGADTAVDQHGWDRIGNGDPIHNQQLHLWRIRCLMKQVYQI